MIGFVIHDEGADALLGELETAAPERALFALELANAVEYAVYLQERRGFFVISDEHLVETLTRFLSRLIDSGLPLTDAAVERALMEAADDEVAWLQAFTAEMRPPIGSRSGPSSYQQKGRAFRTAGTHRSTRGRGGPRPAHEGHWADVTKTLAGGFTARVGNGPIRTYAY